MAWGEWACWRASRQEYPRRPPPAGDREAIVVLGYPSGAGDWPGLVQRYRARVAVRSRAPEASRSVLVFTGAGSRRGARRSEASVMAEYAVRHLGVDPADVVLEERATTTWENIMYSLPLVGSFPVVKVASNTFHARKARRYLWRQAPAVAVRLRRTRDHRFGELFPLKPLLALYRR
ncbi:YdcF family protein [Spiractinospora alimapuensis]|nr:YdcF family protein [Spiractinospora alimapuensis]